ncbi:MAG: DUF3795 domain-containing protein [Proteobacteria bacterium]|nr:DUF3795 domain-containing protein [Pseudomonadota bacterium]
MTQDDGLTACCGLFCQDCIPSKRDFFDAARRLAAWLEDLKFDQYAGMLAEKRPALDDYPAFRSVLSAMTALECPAPCRRGGGKPICAVRDCARGRGYTGCWECGESVNCDLLDPLRNFHGENIDHNLEMIRRYGLADWPAHRGRHYRWS